MIRLTAEKLQSGYLTLFLLFRYLKLLVGEVIENLLFIGCTTMRHKPNTYVRHNHVHKMAKKWHVNMSVKREKLYVLYRKTPAEWQ